MVFILGFAADDDESVKASEGRGGKDGDMTFKRKELE